MSGFGLRNLLEFVMGSRLRASAVALAGNLLPVVTPAVVGLVALRRPSADGLLVALWGALPPLVTGLLAAEWLASGASLAALAAVVGGAWALRWTRSWQAALLTLLATSACATALLGAVEGRALAALAAEAEGVRGRLGGAEMGGVSPLPLLLALSAGAVGAEVRVSFAVGFLAWLAALHALVGLLVARWCQAVLYNPGGFRREIHALRLHPAVAATLAAAIAGAHLSGPEFAPWASLAGIPLLLAAIGLVHHAVAALHGGVGWLCLFYGALVLVGPLTLVLALVGFLDSFVNFRRLLGRA
ncbi:MAG: hypothetical protein KatS3mg124_1220 [Porticoccaceae bacterium]|nr:MAG: hypothetical protein KatS3mg124_1220 [Porticoccaceae bacterium]